MSILKAVLFDLDPRELNSLIGVRSKAFLTW